MVAVRVEFYSNDEAERPVPVFLDPIANPVSPETLKTWAEQPRQAKAG